MSINELPRAAISAIGSTSSLSGPCSVVKELIDNSLDANATSVAVEISHNGLDVIQVKDNGCGILPVDRELACKASYTSKLQTLDDLRNIGPRSLGFRGLALASIAEMSGALVITTRVNGEPVGSVLKYDREGRLLGREPAARPVGTSVRISEFLKHLPVRRKTTLKISAKIIVKVKKLLHAYALARPGVRLSLRVLGGKGDNNWIYPANQNSSVLDAILKSMGSDLASQCLTKEIDVLPTSNSCFDTDDQDNPAQCIKFSATIPKLDSDIQKISKCGQYICIDGRPLATNKGIAKAIVKTYKPYLRSISGQSQSKMAVSDPFLCLHITCPPGSYDVNVEPGKDDVLFENASIILSAAEDLFKDVYGANTTNDTDDQEDARERGNTDSALQSPAICQPRPEVVHAQTPLPVQQPPWLSTGISTSVATATSFRVEKSTIPPDNSSLANPWSRARLNGPTSATGDISPSRPAGQLTPVRVRTRLPLTPLTGQQKLPKAPFTTPRISGIPVAAGLLDSSAVSVSELVTPCIPSQRRSNDGSIRGNGTLDRWLEQLSPEPSPTRNPHRLNPVEGDPDDDILTQSDLSARFGPVSSSNLQARAAPSDTLASTSRPLTLSRAERADSEDQSMLSFSALDSRRAGTSRRSVRMPPLEGGSEIREIQATQCGREILRSPNPRFNRSQNSIQQTFTQSPGVNHHTSLRTKHRPVARDISLSQVGSSPSPMPHRQSNQRSILQPGAVATSGLQRGQNASHASRTLHSAFTSPLPFESIPDRYAVHHLSVTLPCSRSRILSMTSQLASYDSYIRNGEDTFERIEDQTSDVFQIWKTRLDELVRRKWPSDDQITTIDLESIPSGHKRARGE